MNRPPLVLREARSTDHTLIIALSGDLVLTNADALDNAVAEAVAAGRSRVVLDLSAITHVDTPGLALLVRLQDRCEEAGGQLRVAALPASFDEVVEQLRLTRRLQLFDSVESALDSPES